MITIEEKGSEIKEYFSFKELKDETLYEDRTGNQFIKSDDEYIILFSDWSFLTGQTNSHPCYIDFPVTVSNKRIIIEND